MAQKITMERKDGLVQVVIEGGPEISEKEKERIQKEWEKPENQAKLEQLIEIYGEFKKVVDEKSGLAYKVPVKDIITKGLKWEELDKYPIWED